MRICGIPSPLLVLISCGSFGKSWRDIHDGKLELPSRSYRLRLTTQAQETPFRTQLWPMAVEKQQLYNPTGASLPKALPSPSAPHAGFCDKPSDVPVVTGL